MRAAIRRAIRKLKPLFADFSRGVHDLGAFGNASRMKYVANLLVAINNVATAEAMVLGMKAGLDPKSIFETIKTGAGNSRVFELRGPMMVAGNYDDATMKVKVWQKDMQVIGDFAKGLGVPTPLFSATEPHLRHGAEIRPRHAGHRRGLRGDGKDGGCEAAREEAEIARRANPLAVILRCRAKRVLEGCMVRIGPLPFEARHARRRRAYTR